MSGDELAERLIKLKLIITCKDASKIISQSLDGPLPWPDRMKLKFHFLICDACIRFNRQLHILSNAVKGIRNNIENNSTIQLSLNAKTRIISMIDSKNY
ncbi:MAG: zf-HC2 domain-containing protein [Methylotenera sp.]|nr:zf-HC2 domain-containing protein [Methylotenera sp.]